MYLPELETSAHLLDCEQFFSIKSPLTSWISRASWGHLISRYCRITVPVSKSTIYSGM